MALDRRAFLLHGLAGGTICLPSIGRSQQNGVLRPEDFGARGDGVTTDTEAFAALSNHVNRQGGGTISLAKGRTYVVGKQARDPKRYFLTGKPILRFERLNKPLHIFGNGARLVAERGLMFGVFDEETLAPFHR